MDCIGLNGLQQFCWEAPLIGSAWFSTLLLGGCSMGLLFWEAPSYGCGTGCLETMMRKYYCLILSSFSICLCLAGLQYVDLSVINLNAWSDVCVALRDNFFEPTPWSGWLETGCGRTKQLDIQLILPRSVQNQDLNPGPLHYDVLLSLYSKVDLCPWMPLNIFSKSCFLNNSVQWYWIMFGVLHCICFKLWLQD